MVPFKKIRRDRVAVSDEIGEIMYIPTRRPYILGEEFFPEVFEVEDNGDLRYWKSDEDMSEGTVVPPDLWELRYILVKTNEREQ